jgi:hypothetical protein
MPLLSVLHFREGPLEGTPEAMVEGLLEQVRAS